MNLSESTLKCMVFQKLFIAFSEIVVVLINHSDFDANTRNVLSVNISNISKVLLDVSTAAPQPSPRRKLAKGNKKKTSAAIESTPRLTRSAATNKDNSVPAAGPSHSVPIVGVEPSELAITAAAGPSHSAAIVVVEPSELDVLVSAEPTAEDLENELVALGRPKSLFLSGLPVATTEKAIKNHIAKKVPDFPMDAITISKLPSKGSYSSFVVNMGRKEDLFNVLNSSEMWPQQTIVHEFKKGRNNRLFRGSRSN